MLTVELHGINQFFTGYSDFWKALRLGGELSIGNKVFIRGGLTSGYPSFGMEVNFYIFSFGFLLSLLGLTQLTFFLIFCDQVIK